MSTEMEKVKTPAKRTATKDITAEDAATANTVVGADVSETDTTEDDTVDTDTENTDATNITAEDAANVDNSNCTSLTTIPQTATTDSVTTSCNLDEIAFKIQESKQHIELSFLEIGRLLNEAKFQLNQHGAWLDWLRSNVQITSAYAQRLMQLAREYQSNTYPVTHLGVKKAHALLALPPEDREAFLEESHTVYGSVKTADKMSAKELKEAINQRKGLKKKKTVSRKQPTETILVMPREDDTFDLDTNMELLQSFIDGLIKKLEDLPERRSELANALRDIFNDTLQLIPES